jgi:hypothetical protein
MMMTAKIDDNMTLSTHCHDASDRRRQHAIVLRIEMKNRPFAGLKRIFDDTTVSHR